MGVPLEALNGPIYAEPMEQRVLKVEEFVVEARDRLTRIESRLDQTATKAELAQAVSDLIRWMVGLTIVLGATAITIITFVLNYATPPKLSAAQLPPAPIVIQLPAYPPTTPK